MSIQINSRDSNIHLETGILFSGMCHLPIRGTVFIHELVWPRTNTSNKWAGTLNHLVHGTLATPCDQAGLAFRVIIGLTPLGCLRLHEESTQATNSNLDRSEDTRTANDWSWTLPYSSDLGDFDCIGHWPWWIRLHTALSMVSYILRIALTLVS